MEKITPDRIREMKMRGEKGAGIDGLRLSHGAAAR